MQALSRFTALAAAQVRVNHFPDNRTWPYDGHLHDDVIETFRPEPREAGHLRTAFHLKQTDSIGALQGRVDSRVVRGEMSQVDFLLVMTADELKGLLEYGHHPETEKIDLDDAPVGTVFFVPLNDNAAGHGGWFQWNDGI